MLREGGKKPKVGGAISLAEVSSPTWIQRFDFYGCAVIYFLWPSEQRVVQGRGTMMIFIGLPLWGSSYMWCF